MSTKTLIKRIALVAVSALGFSLLSVAPSQGAVTWIVAGKNTEDDGVALAASKYTASKVLSASGISAFSVVAASVVEIEIIANDDLVAASGYKVSMTGFGVVLNDVLVGGAGDELLAPFTATSVPGTYPLTILVDEDDDFTTLGDQYTASVTMTVTAPSAWSSTLSTAYIEAGAGGGVATIDDDSYTASGSATLADVNRGAITMTFNNVAGTAMTTGNTVTAQITSGPGYLVALTDNVATAATCDDAPTYSATVGRAISAFAVDALSHIIICADGTPGVATIVLSVTNQSVTTTWATKSFTFYGAVRTLSVAASNFTIGAAGGDETGAGVTARTLAGEVTNAGALTAGTTTPAFIISAKDSAGQLATAAAAPVVISSNVSVVASGTCALDDGATAYSSGEGFGLYNCSFTTAASAVSGQTATLTFRIADPLGTAGIDYLTTTAVVTVGGGRYKETISLDKATYNAGEAMVVTRTAVDSSGNNVADGSAAPQVVFNKQIGGTTPGAGFYVGGKLVTSATKPAVFAPTAPGVFEARITGYNNSSTATSPIIATATIGADAATVAAEAATDAAAEAIDAANAATDAANLAAEAADAATVAAEEARDAADAATAAVEALAAEVATLMAALKAQITTLANTVAKIAKKVKA